MGNLMDVMDKLMPALIALFGAQYGTEVRAALNFLLGHAKLGIRRVERYFGYNFPKMAWYGTLGMLILNALALFATYKWVAWLNNPHLNHMWESYWIYWLAFVAAFPVAVLVIQFKSRAPSIDESMGPKPVEDGDPAVRAQRTVRDAAVLNARNAFNAAKLAITGQHGLDIAQARQDYAVDRVVDQARQDHATAVGNANAAHATAMQGANTSHAQALANAQALPAPQQATAIRQADTALASALAAADRVRASMVAAADATRDAALLISNQERDNAIAAADLTRDQNLEVATQTRDNAISVAEGAFKAAKKVVDDAALAADVASFANRFGSPNSPIVAALAVFVPMFIHAGGLYVTVMWAARHHGLAYGHALMMLFLVLALVGVAHTAFNLVGTFLGWTIDGAAEWVYRILGEVVSMLRGGAVAGLSVEQAVAEFRSKPSPFQRIGAIVRTADVWAVEIFQDMLLFAFVLYSMEASLYLSAFLFCLRRFDAYLDKVAVTDDDRTKGQNRRKFGMKVYVYFMLAAALVRFDIAMDSVYGGADSMFFTTAKHGHLAAIATWVTSMSDAVRLSGSVFGLGFVGFIAAILFVFVSMPWYMAIPLIAVLAATVLWLVKHVDPKATFGKWARGLAVVACLASIFLLISGFSLHLTPETARAAGVPDRIVTASQTVRNPDGSETVTTVQSAPAPTPPPAEQPGVATRIGRFLFGTAPATPAPAQQVPDVATNSAPSPRHHAHRDESPSDPCASYPATTLAMMRRRGHCL